MATEQQRTRRQRTAATGDGAATTATATATGTSEAGAAESGTGSAEDGSTADTSTATAPADDAGQTAASGAGAGDETVVTAVSAPASDPSTPRARLVALVDDARLGDVVIEAIIHAIHDAIAGGAFAGVGLEGARFMLAPIGDGDVATLSEDADAVIDAIVAGKVPDEALAALRMRLDPFAVDVGGTRNRYAVSGEVRRRFPVVSDVMNGGTLIEAGGDVVVTEPEFDQLRAGLSIEATWTWDQGDPVQDAAAEA